MVVIPFANRSGPDLNWIGESLAERIGEILLARGFTVVDREERLEVYRRLSLAQSARLTRASLWKVAEELDAGLAISGEFEVGGAPAPGSGPASRTIRISAFMIDARRLEKGPAWLEQGPLADLSRLQTRLTWQVLRSLDPANAPTLDQFLTKHPPVRVEAIENYIRGLLAASLEQKQRYFAEAARLDPGFSAPCFQLGRLHFERKEYGQAAAWLGRVQSSDANFLHATFLLGICRYNSGDYTAAQAAFERVRRELPLNEVLNNLAAAQSRRDLPEALENFLTALDGDPSDPDYHFNAGYALWKRGEFQAAAERLRAALDRNPEDREATRLLGRCLQNSGPRPGDPKDRGLERIKLSFEERAWRELSARFRRTEP